MPEEYERWPHWILNKKGWALCPYCDRMIGRARDTDTNGYNVKGCWRGKNTTMEIIHMKRHDPYPYRQWCPICGWHKGGKDSWDGKACKCGFQFHKRGDDDSTAEVPKVAVHPPTPVDTDERH